MFIFQKRIFPCTIFKNKRYNMCLETEVDELSVYIISRMLFIEDLHKCKSSVYFDLKVKLVNTKYKNSDSYNA